MRVFFSWSGEKSRSVAEGFQRWIAQVIQAVEPWISSDITKGTRWGPEMTEMLEQSRVGIICLTKDNLESPWILFEAGALSKTKDAHVCTLLLDIDPSDIEPPLSQFQHTSTDKNDIKKLVETINDAVSRAHQKALAPQILNEVFETNWDSLDRILKEAVSMQDGKQRPARSQKDMIIEVLDLVRHHERRLYGIERIVRGDDATRWSRINQLLYQERLKSISDTLFKQQQKEGKILSSKLAAELRAELLPETATGETKSLPGESATQADGLGGE